ncbi:hypothetical protein M409DRAFT_24005 [Zasmidium cellare ATCC 36951]|uniref:Transcription factor domain-containing protein n=1 Tax=Zasmidium cellare ATCC 36951 TaxID=1080233 RepID=A0A6A6CF11_ZASCE|nr:uncharacterized protein M409DRAFT_24005 [Zasmidium cellare ATCC 36951]KAF2165715.1 hypothetical protein M409DRAFT_24005 [Zasmidium cellare ATCC 36951]
MATDMPFIISSIGQYGDGAKNRQLVRRHVMLGKNKGKKRPRKPFRLEQDHESPLGDADQSCRGKDYNVPPKVGTDLSFIDFADTVELSLIGDILKFTKISKQTFFPLEPCIAFDKKLKFQQSFVPLTFDALYLNAMVFSTQSWYCATTSRTIDKRISYHLVKSIGLLRDRLTDAAGEGGKERISDPTINAIVMLAGQALLMGEEKTARKHVVGMKRLVEMRGGLSTLEKNTKLLLEVLRIDISLALYTDSPPIFRDACSKERWFRLPQTASTCEAERHTPHLVSDELIQLWLTMHHFATLINNATSAGHKLPEELMLETMAAVMHRLLDMTFEDSSVEEAVRLGLLAFCSQAFLPWMSVKLPFDMFPQAYVRCMEAVTTSGSITPGLAMWLLTIGSIALFSPGCVNDSMQSSLRGIIVGSGVKCWEDMRGILKGYLWLDLIFDDVAATLLRNMMEVPRQDDDTSANST